MDELSKAAREILSDMRASEVPKKGARERVRRHLAASLGGASAAAIGTASASAASTSVAAGGAASVVSVSKLALWVALGTLGGGAVLAPVAVLSEPPRAVAVEKSERKSASQFPSKREAPAVVPTAAPPADPSEPLESVAPEAPNVVRAAPRHVEAQPANNLSAETELLAKVRERLRAGRATESLALLAEHARRFPNGALSEEAAASHVLALCAAGRISEADAEKARFHSSYPRSPLGPRIERACAR